MKSSLEEKPSYLSWFKDEKRRSQWDAKVEGRRERKYSLDKGTKGAGEAVKAGKVWLWREVRHLISRTKEGRNG